MNKLVLLLIVICSVPPLAAAQHAAEKNDATGYYNRTGTDILVGTHNTTPRFFTVNGYRFNDHFSAGIGVGYVPYDDPLELFPVFADITYHTSDGNISPFFYVRLGYGISRRSEDDTFMETHEGGVMINPGVGLQFRTCAGWGWYLNAGFNRDRSAHSFESWGTQTVNNNYSYKRINLGLGITF